jgi:hypothetical protein
VEGVEAPPREDELALMVDGVFITSWPTAPIAWYSALALARDVLRDEMEEGEEGEGGEDIGVSAKKGWERSESRDARFWGSGCSGCIRRNRFV